MPIYTYRCENCGVQFDRRQKFSDDPLKVCSECETETLRKVYQPVGILFKGSGFYSTDNRSSSGGNGSRKTEAEGTEEKVDKVKKAEKSTDSKTSSASDDG